MIFSRDRILTTHVGSLPRNEKLSDLLLRQEAGESFDAPEMAAEMDKAVGHVVGKQVSAGIDIGNDGEQQRVGFQTYVPQRMSGFGGISKRRRGKELSDRPAAVPRLCRAGDHRGGCRPGHGSWGARSDSERCRGSQKCCRPGGFRPR